MELTISDEKIKDFMREIIIEMIQEKRDLFYDIILEAIEEIALSNAIAEGQKTDFVSEDRILDILNG